MAEAKIPAISITVGDVLMAYGYGYNADKFGDVEHGVVLSIESKLEAIADALNRHIRFGNLSGEFDDYVVRAANKCGVELPPHGVPCPVCKQDFGVTLIDPNVEDYYTNKNKCRLCGNVWEKEFNRKDCDSDGQMRCPECDSNETGYVFTTKAGMDCYYCSKCGLDWFCDPK